MSIFNAKSKIVLCNQGCLVKIPVSEILPNEELSGCLMEDLTQAKPVVCEEMLQTYPDVAFSGFQGCIVIRSLEI